MVNSATVELAYNGFYKAVHRHCTPPHEEWLFYKENMIPRTFKKGEFFLQPNQPSNVYAYIYSGIMKQYFLTVDGKEFITRFDCPDETSGDAATLWQRKPARQFIPVWNIGGRSVAEIRFIEKCDREFELLSFDALTRYELFLKRHGVHSSKISQKDIASYIGVTPSSLNKIIKSQQDGKKT
jgi:CRP-like cAMP-binding protein